MWLAVAAALVACGAAAQEPGAQFGEEVTVTEVLLDAVVTDRDDHIIVGLGPDDFVVAEGERIVELASVSFYSSKRALEPATPGGGARPEVDSVPRDRYFILFLKTGQASGIGAMRRRTEIGRELARWLVEVAQPSDRVAVLSYRRGLRVHQDFTTDREALLAAVDGAVRGLDPGKIPASRRHVSPEGPHSFSTLPAGRELRKRTDSIYRAFRTIAEVVDPIPDRKNLIFVGPGFGEIGSYGGYRPQTGRLTPTLQALNDANVAVYTIDPAGPDTLDPLQTALRDLADATGGRYYSNQRAVDDSLRRIEDLTSGYYLLAYQARRAAGATGYQPVRVGTRSPEFRIQARSGYLYGPPTQAPPLRSDPP